MMAGKTWSDVKLSDVIDVKHGFAFPGGNIREEPPGDILLTPGNFAIGGGFKGDKYKYFDGEVPEEYVLHENDLIVTMTDLSKQADTLGYPAFVPKPLRFRFLHNQRLGKIVIRDAAKVDKRFISYLLRTPEYRHEVLASATGTTVKHTSPSRILAFKTSIPPLPEQGAIAHILGTLDDKIELNRRLNETLEAMARALFKSWFVDFDPVRAKVEGRYLGLPKPLADLFPDRLEYSEVGEIPEGWGVGNLADFSSVNLEAWTKETRPAVINYIDLSNTKWGRIEAVTAYSQQNAPSRAQRVLRPRDTIVGTVRPGNGSYAFISEDGLTGSTGFAVLRPLRPDYGGFVYLAATAAENIEALSHLADGGAYPAVRPEVVAATQVIRPALELLGKFSRIAGPLLAKMAENEHESRTIVALRDTLLPRLVSGELRLKNREGVTDAH
jgi:type I restriction enzyme S subunit